MVSATLLTYLSIADRLKKEGTGTKRTKPTAVTWDADIKFRCDFKGFGGARRDRTDDLLLAKQALSQLSYGP